MRDFELTVHYLISRLAHDLKNPLAVVLANLRFLLEENRDSALLDVLQESLFSAEKTVRMIDDLVDLQLLRSEKFQLTSRRFFLPDIEPMIRAAVEPQAGHRVINIDLPAVQLMTDNSLFIRALINLLEHGLRQSPSGETIHLRAELAQGLELQMIDAGAPFCPHVPPSVVAEELCAKEAPPRPWRTDQGIGLYFVGTVIRALGGTARVTDREDGKRGVVFRLFFPPQQVETR